MPARWVSTTPNRSCEAQLHEVGPLRALAAQVDKRVHSTHVPPRELRLDAGSIPRVETHPTADPTGSGTFEA